MNFKIASAALIVAAAGNALAESPIIVNDPFVSTRNRAEVQAELFAYKQAGVNPWSTSYNQLRGFQGRLSREQVVAEYLAARDEVAAMSGEDSGSAHLAQGPARFVRASATLASHSAPGQ